MLTEAELVLIAREVKTRSGAVITREMSSAAAVRLQPLARREGFTTVSELVAAARIRPDGALWNAVADHLAQTETRFFRDKPQFENLRTSLLPAAMQRRGLERVRIWSAGCSTGQEAYSVAMLIDDMRTDGVNISAEILATDLSERVLDKARSGLYTQFEVQRGLPIRKLIAHFEKAGDLWRISDRLRAAVKFERHNLLHHPEQLGRFDIVILANVLPSFDAATRVAVLERISDVLESDGVILLGANETLPEECEQLTLDCGVVRRKDAARAAA